MTSDRALIAIPAAATAVLLAVDAYTAAAIAAAVMLALCMGAIRHQR